MKLFTALTALALLAGCGAKVPSGMAGARVSVRAEPKAGYRPELQPSGGGYDSNPDSDDPGPRRFPFQKVNYASLNDIVVWLEPDGAPAASAPAPRPLSIDAGASLTAIDRAVKATAVGGEVRLENRSQRPVNVFLRSEQGTVADAGAIPAGGSGSARVTAPGFWQVLREGEGDGAEDVLIAQVYAAPSGWVRTTVSGGDVTFTPLAPGRYVAHAWHPRLPGSSRPLTLSADRVTDVTLTLSVNPLPKVP